MDSGAGPMNQANVRTPRLFPFPHATSSLFTAIADSFPDFTPPELQSKTYVGDLLQSRGAKDQGDGHCPDFCFQ